MIPNLASLIPEVMALNDARQEVDDATVELIAHIDHPTPKRAAARSRFHRAMSEFQIAEARLQYSKSRILGVPHLRVLWSPDHDRTRKRATAS